MGQVVVWEEPLYRELTEDFVAYAKKDVKDSVLFHGRAPSRDAIKVKIVPAGPEQFGPFPKPRQKITATAVALVDEAHLEDKPDVD